MIKRALGLVLAAALFLTLAGASPVDRAVEGLALGDAYVVVEITDLDAPRPLPYRVKALTRRDGRVLARIFWPPEDRGANVLLTSTSAAAYFPRADLLVTQGAGSRGLGLDPALWRMLLDPVSAFRAPARSEARARCEAGPCRIREVAAAPGSGCDKLALWALEDATPLRAACIGGDGTESWGIRFGDPVTVRGAARPRALTWESGGRVRARLRVVFFEADPPLPAEMFTLEGLKRWR